MTPRKARHHRNPSQPVPASDYESDLNYLSDVPPPPSNRTDEELNLSVLKRHDSAVISLEYVTPYAVVYVFSPTSQQWEKSGIEGTAFICGLSPTEKRDPRYSVLVLNRRGLENLNVELLTSNDVEVTEEYIILQSAKDGIPQVYGLWVFSEPPPSSTSHQRAAMAHKIQECTARVEMGRRPAEEHHENGDDTVVEDSVLMGRQVSLKELFGQQRQNDDAWSVRSHSPQRPPMQLTVSTDTDFLRTSQRHAQPHLPAASAQSNGRKQDDLLGLFRQAGEKYNGIG